MVCSTMSAPLAAKRMTLELKEHRSRRRLELLTNGLQMRKLQTLYFSHLKVPRSGVEECARSVLLRARRPTAITGCCGGLSGDEGTRLSRTRRRMVSGPPNEKRRSSELFSFEDRVQKALSVHEIYVSSFCSTCRRWLSPPPSGAGSRTKQSML